MLILSSIEDVRSGGQTGYTAAVTTQAIWQATGHFRRKLQPTSIITVYQFWLETGLQLEPQQHYTELQWQEEW